jgi:hypothetical protein
VTAALAAHVSFKRAPAECGQARSINGPFGGTAPIPCLA